MNLRLNVTAYCNQPPTTAMSVTYTEQGGTLGRATNNSWVLPDPERLISSKHASITCQNGQFRITDISTNGLFINNAAQPLGRGNSTPLNSGDKLIIGDYIIEVIIEGLTPAMDNQPLSAVETSPFGSDDFFNTPPSATSSKDADPFGLSQPEAPLNDGHSAFFEATSPEPSPPTPSAIDDIAATNEFFQVPQSIPDDWDILDEKHAIEEPIAKSSQPQEILNEPVPASFIPDDLFDSETSPPGTPTDEVLPAELAASPPPAAVQAKPLPAHTPSSNSEQEALNLILQGAGIEKLEIPPDQSRETLLLIGGLMREMTGGLLEVLRARAEIKSEFRMQLTTIRAVENNPLKFSISVDDALQHLLATENSAYLPAKEAVREAVDNIEAHQLAVMAGIQGALTAMLQRFEPTTLEAYFNQKGGKGLLENTKAWYWEQFAEKHKEILAEAEDNFQELFGEAFARAYEEQIANLVKARKAEILSTE
jgi:type VI secretion system protein